MLNWIMRSVDNERIKKLEAEVADLRREHVKLKVQNEAMIECVENIAKYERQLVGAIEELANDLANTIKRANGE